MRGNKRKIPLSIALTATPIILLFFIFHTVPFLRGVFYSFTDWAGYGEYSFVGFKNYSLMFKNGQISEAYLFTFKFAIAATILVNAIALALAVALNGRIKLKKTLRATYFMPYMLGTLVVSYIFNYIFAAVIPSIAKSAGWTALTENILGTSNAWIGILIVALWQGAAFNTLIYLAGLQSIPGEIYEAAELDGTTGWTKFWKITFPLISPFFTINLVLSVKNYLMVFDQIMALTGGGPGNSTTSISLLIYKQGFQGSQFAIQSANAVLLFIIVAAISLFQMRVLSMREEKYS